MNSNTSRLRARGAYRLAALLGTASFAAIAASGAALAQGQVMPPAQGQPVVAQNAPPEQVLITGSLISGAVAVGVPVSALSTQDFIQTGQLSLNDILKSVPALDIDAQPSPTYGGGTLSFLQNVQIHSLGTGSGVETLLLINGLRFPPQNYSNDTVNPSIIPQIAIQRVDVLTAGASAVYGSDATAGVINIILKRGYDGAMTQTSVTTSPGIGYLSAQFAQLYGKSWDTGNITVSYTVTDSRPVKGSERSYYTQDFTPWGLMDATPRTSSFPGIAHIGNAATVPNSPAGETAASGTIFCANCFSIPQGQNGVGLTWAQITANPGVHNERNPWAFADVRPRLQWNQAHATFDQQLTNDFFGLGPVSVFADAFYSNQRGKQFYPAGNGQARAQLNGNLVIPTNNPFYPVGAPANIRVDYSLEYEIPTIIVGGETAGHYDFGFNLDKLPFGWTGKLTYSMTDDKNYGDAPTSINANNVRAALGQVVTDNNTGFTYTKPAGVPYLNVFCDPTAFTCNDPATLSYVTGYRLQHEQFKIQETGFNFSGPVFELPGGPLEVAIAGQTLSEHWTFQQIENYSTANTSLINNGTDAASQNSYALFGQVNIPIIGENNAIPFVRGFLIEAGYRYDHYNNLDDPVWTPKIAANWDVGAGLTLRAAWGKSFRVPSFAENSPGGSRFAGLNPLGGAVNQTDTAFLSCNSVDGSPAGVAIPGSLTAILNPTCSIAEDLRQPGAVSVELSGNGAAAVLRGHGLSPQTLKQWSTGFHFAPAEPFFGVNLSGLSVDVSWFRLEFKGLIDNNGPLTGPPNPDDPADRGVYTVIPRPDLPITAPENAAFFQLVKDLAAVPNRGGFAFDTTLINDVKFIQDIALTNVGSRVFGGIDFDARYDFDLANVGLTDFGSINIGAAGYYQTVDKSRANATAPLDDRYQGKDSGNRLQRVRYRLGWQNESWNVTAFANYSGHGNIQGNNLDGANLVPPCFYQQGFGPGSCFPGSGYYGPAGVFPNMTPAVVYWDLSIGYQTGETPANEYLRNIGVQFTINDLFDKKPPFSVGARGNGAIRAFDNAFIDLQRTFTLTLTKVW